MEEPPRNVLFLWDTSGSVAGYQPAIYNALNAYADDLVPGRDAADLLPLGRSRPLLQDWHGDPYVVQQVLNYYPRGDDSSAAETALAVAARALAPRAGSKVIVVVTDASTARDAALWVELDEARPRVFALGAPSAGSLLFGPQQEQDLMQDWAWVNGGHYTDVRDAGEMEVAFARATAMLRRPAGYTLRAEASFEEARGPGLLRVVGEVGQDTPGGGAVELILDGSGSMLKRLGGERRIDIARDVLIGAIRERIPEGTPLALRVFGRQEANACRTDLEIPLAPLDPDAAMASIQGISARNLAKTPIADSLARVEADLSGVEGKKLVVLVTDGEETCEGDPAAVIERLNQRGLEVSVNIVGFALDDPELEGTFSAWAELGGGRYFSARDRQGLNAALGKALEVPYAVYDRSGTLIAEGAVNGEPVELAAGGYRIVLPGSPPRTFTEVVVEGE